MPVETFNYLDSLNSANPVPSDSLPQGDDHIRGIKAVLKATFPSVAGVCSITHTQLSNLGAGNLNIAGDGTSTAPSIGYASDATIGFYKVSTGIQGIVGRLTGDGACATGMQGNFFHATIPTGWYETNGQAVPRTGSTAALFALIGTTYGAGNGSTTFNLPDTTDRYTRSRGANAVGTLLADAIKSHTATISGTAADHLHSVAAGCSISLSASTGVMIHNEGGGGGAAGDVLLNSGSGSNPIPVTGSVSFSTNTAASGALALTGTASYTGSTETRPLSIVVVSCIKA